MIAFFFLALTVPGFVRAVRTLGWVDRRMLAGEKPWACDVCMTFWSTVAWVGVAYRLFGDEAFMAAPPAYFAALVLLERAAPIPHLLPPPPPDP